MKSDTVTLSHQALAAAFESLLIWQRPMVLRVLPPVVAQLVLLEYLATHLLGRRYLHAFDAALCSECLHDRERKPRIPCVMSVVQALPSLIIRLSYPYV